MRKKIYTLAATAVFSLAFAFSALAATAKISFSDPKVSLGSDVNVTMKVASGDGTLSNADVTVAYDAKLLEFVSGTDADGGAGTVRIHGASNGAGTGTLEYNLKFKSLAAGSANVTITTQEVYDTDEQLVDIQHEGSSVVTIAAPASASTDAALSALTVSPGSLSPAFSADVTSYEVSVGTDVDVLAVNATAADSGASVALSGNENLQMGENTVTVTVTAADGTTKSTYTIKAIKQDGGASLEGEGATETVNQGVKLSAKEKTITIMNPGSDVKIPEGFAESSIDIDGHQVRGWVWKADTEHAYCIFYGMNDAGELNFYRYDLSEKTIQRYFSDPIEVEQAENAEKYPALVESYDALVERYNVQFLLSCVLGIVALALVIVIVVLLRRNKRGGGKVQPKPVKAPTPTAAQSQSAPEKDTAERPKRGQARAAKEAVSDETVILRRAVEALPSLSEDEEELGVTQVLRRPARGFGAEAETSTQAAKQDAQAVQPPSEPDEPDDDLGQTRVMHLDGLDLENLSFDAEEDEQSEPKLSAPEQAEADEDSDVKLATGRSAWKTKADVSEETEDEPKEEGSRQAKEAKPLKAEELEIEEL